LFAWAFYHRHIFLLFLFAAFNYLWLSIVVSCFIYLCKNVFVSILANHLTLSVRVLDKITYNALVHIPFHIYIHDCSDRKTKVHKFQETYLPYNISFVQSLICKTRIHYLTNFLNCHSAGFIHSTPHKYKLFDDCINALLENGVDRCRPPIHSLYD
jgi:hypothetical protein